MPLIVWASTCQLYMITWMPVQTLTTYYACCPTFFSSWLIGSANLLATQCETWIDVEKAHTFNNPNPTNSLHYKLSAGLLHWLLQDGQCHQDWCLHSWDHQNWGGHSWQKMIKVAYCWLSYSMLKTVFCPKAMISLCTLMVALGTGWNVSIRGGRFIFKLRLTWPCLEGASQLASLPQISLRYCKNIWTLLWNRYIHLET